jgi:menaquinone-dependent protoporphyrinogen oxidase
MPPHVLLVFASSHGQTRKIAVTIAAQLRHAGIEVDLADALAGAVPAPDGYDAVVVGSRVELGKHAAPVLRYLERHGRRLVAMPTAFFSVSMSASERDAGADPGGYLRKTFTAIGWTPSRMIAFAGGLPYRKYGRILRFVMKRISAAARHPTDTSRDHEATDWDAVVAFADRIADDVRAIAVARTAAVTAPISTSALN